MSMRDTTRYFIILLTFSLSIGNLVATARPIRVGVIDKSKFPNSFSNGIVILAAAEIVEPSV